MSLIFGGMRAGLKINEKTESHFVTRYENLVAISQILVAKSPRCIVLSVSGLAKTYEPAILVCKETAENGE